MAKFSVIIHLFTPKKKKKASRNGSIIEPHKFSPEISPRGLGNDGHHGILEESGNAWSSTNILEKGILFFFL